MSEEFSALIIGCGAIAGGYDETTDSDAVLTHAKAYHIHPRFRIAACVEPDTERREKFMAHWNIPRGYATLAEAEGVFDIVSLCATTAAHADLLEQILERRVRIVWAEKPLTSDVARSRGIVEAYRAAGRPIAVNYFRRWAPEIQALAREIKDGRWGILQKAVISYVRGLLNNGSHAIDLMHMLFGPLRPVAVHGRILDGFDHDPTLDVQLATEAGAPIYLLGCDGRAFGLFEVTLIFENGRVTLADSGFSILRQPVADNPRFAGHRALSLAEARPTGLDRAMLGTLDNIRAHLDHGEKLASDAASALAAQEICAAFAGMAAQPA